MDNKTDLRLKAKNIRKRLNIEDISTKIVSNIRATHEYMFSKNIMIYYPLNYEINLLALLEDENKCFYLPRVCGKDLVCCPYKVGDSLILSPLNIREPMCGAVDKSEIDMIFIPALMVDMNFNRLGYGGGFYDRFLSGMTAHKIVPIPEELLVLRLPTDNYDIPCDGIITQKKASFIRG